MLKARLKAGYRRLSPDTFMVCILSPLRYLLGKLSTDKREGVFDAPPTDIGPEFECVEEFGREFDEFFERVAPAYGAILIKDSAYMNWRYKAPPFRKYHSFYRIVAGRIVSILILKTTGNAGYIVDLIWDRADAGEPARTIRFSKSLMRKCGFIKLYCWSSFKDLRTCLKKQRFVDQGDTLRASIKSDNDLVYEILNEGGLHVVEGDGDSEYL
jgi:hypothetical protein